MILETKSIIINDGLYLTTGIDTTHMILGSAYIG